MPDAPPAIASADDAKPEGLKLNNLTDDERGKLVLGIDRLLWKIAGKQAKIFGRPHDAEDMHSEAMIAALEAARYFEPARGLKFASFATKWAERRIFRVLYADRENAKLDRPGQGLDLLPDRRKPEVSESPDAEQVEEAGFDDLYRTVQDAAAMKRIAQLTPGFRRLVEMVVIDRLTPLQISLQLGHSLKTVLTNLQGAIAKLTGVPFPAELTSDPVAVAASRVKAAARKVDPEHTAKLAAKRQAASALTLARRKAKRVPKDASELHEMRQKNLANARAAKKAKWDAARLEPAPA